MTQENMVTQNTSSYLPLAKVQAQIDHAAKIAGRDASDITLIAVSKTKPVAEIMPLMTADHHVFGENRVQEADDKWPPLKLQNSALDLHLVGQLQSNKAEDAVRLFSHIHSVDRASLITALARAQDKLGCQPRCFLQVNIGNEDQKGGCSVDQISVLLKAAQDAGVHITGLMAVPPHDREPAPYFALLAKLARDNGLAHLSMGMSADIETAIMCGATHVRVGTALFGAR